jgi:hypothetical protein
LTVPSKCRTERRVVHQGPVESHHSLLEGRAGGGAADRNPVVAGDVDEKGLDDIGPGERHQQAADRAPGHGEGELAIGRAHDLRQGAARSDQIYVPLQLALGRLEIARALEEGGKVETVEA